MFGKLLSLISGAKAKAAPVQNLRVLSELPGPSTDQPVDALSKYEDQQNR